MNSTATVHNPSYKRDKEFIYMAQTTVLKASATLTFAQHFVH